uniref:MBD domain-containing protein n=1 Tax=Fagus sylvatica TaxID=28930 RepID=A0A2N9FWF5_FAGSY
MSTSETSGQDPNPILRDPNTLGENLPPDPLLKSGSFIAVADRTAEPPHMRRSSDAAPACLAAEKSNGEAEPVTPSPATDNTASQDATQTRRIPSIAPDWLPAGLYYYDPASASRFRSKKEVLYFLETGTKRKKKKENSDADADADTMGSGSQNQKKSGTKAKSSALKFDYSNVPEKVEWVLTDFSQGSWAPFIGDKKVPESTVQEWAAAFTALSSRRSRSDFQI